MISPCSVLGGWPGWDGMGDIGRVSGYSGRFRS